MSVRYLKKVLKEQEAAAALHEQLNSDEDDTESPTPIRNPFDLLEADIDCDDGDHQNGSDQENDDVAGETSAHDTVGQHSSTVKVAVNTVSINVKSKKKKKKKVRESFSKSTGSDASSSSLALEKLNLEASSSSSQVDDLPAKQKIIDLNGFDMMKKQHKSSTLEVDPKFLNAESEMRRIFGSKVVNSYERSRASSNPRQVRGGRRVSHNLKRTILVSPSEHWPRWDGSLSMELLDTSDGVHYFRYTHSPSYAQAQRGFEAAKAIHDFNGIASILLHNPYHIDSLITLADYFKFTGEHEMSADATSKCLYALECAWHPQFTPSSNCQLKYVHDENKPFFSSLFTHMKNMDRRGCHRSALEICKMLLSLDSDDPKGAKLCIDYYALRAEEYSWLERFAEEHGNDNSLWLFPNFSYSLAISRFYLERRDNDDTGKAAASELMKQALMLHPSVLKKLVEKVPLKERVWSGILNHSFFSNNETGSPSLDHLISIYVERSYLIWRLPDLQKLLSDSALSVIEKQVNEAKDWACVRKEAFSSQKNEYSHLLVSDFSDAMPTMPPENLQDFMVDPRGGMVNGQEFAQVPAEQLIRDVANRNPLAVLFESMLPWVNFGHLDGEEVQDDVRDRADQD